MSEIYSMLVLRHGLSPQYVLDEMETYEIKALMNCEYYSHKDDWEQARLIAFMIAQVNSRKKLKFEDITSFYWEKEEEESTAITKSDIQRLRERAKEYLNIEKQNGGNCN